MLPIDLPEDIERQPEALAAGLRRSGAHRVHDRSKRRGGGEARLQDFRERRSGTISLQDFVRKHDLAY